MGLSFTIQEGWGQHGTALVTAVELGQAEASASPASLELSASWVSSGLRGVSVPTGRRGTGGESWQGRAPGTQHHGPEGGEAWPEAQTPTGECSLSRDPRLCGGQQ